VTPHLLRVGASQTPVVVIDAVSGEWPEIADMAAALAPFPRAAGNYYPGLRRFIDERDASAFAYVGRTLAAVAPFIGGAFDADGFDLVEASFSIVTTPPAMLVPAQRAPHFDSTDPKRIAVLHYLSDTPGTGTAFYRQRATGIEVVDERNFARFATAAKQASGDRPAAYIDASDAHYERIGAVEGIADRLILYRGNLPHSGIIPAELMLSADPRRGRLTANLFVQAH